MYPHGVNSRNSPSPPDSQHSNHSYPPAASDDMNAASRPFGGPRQTSSAQSSTHSSFGDDMDAPRFGHPYSNYSSTPSLPRYSSGQSSSSSTNYLPQPSPLNPTAMRGGRDPYQTGPPQRFSSAYAFGGNGGGHVGPPGNGNGGAHPLSNAMYLESSPTLAGSDMRSPSEEKMRLNAGQGDYTSVPLTSSAGDKLPQRQTSLYRRGTKAKGLAALYRGWSGGNLADSGRDERHIKLPRLGYLDGCKFIAAFVVLNGTLFDATISTSDYSFIQRNSPLYIVRSSGLGLVFLLLLSGRSLITPLWDVPSRAVTTANEKQPNTALISWARLTRAMLVRPFRFILPVIAVAALQWGLAGSGKTSNCNNVGMDEPYWGLISNFAGFSTLIFDLFTYYEANTLAGQTFSANLWTNAWFFQASYAAYTTHLMLGNLSSNRYWVYIILAFFSWTTYNYMYVALLGLIIADMHAHGHLHTIRTKWPAYQRLTLHAILIAIALVTQFLPIVRDNINKGMAVINVQNHPEITFCDTIFAACWLFAIETSGLAQNILGNIVMRNLGKLSAGMYLLSPSIVFTIVPNLALSMHNNGTKASSVLGLSWLVLFLIVIAISIAFHFVVELPSKMIGEVVAEVLEGAEGSFRTRKSGEATKLVKRHIGGGQQRNREQRAGPAKLQGGGSKRPVLA